MTTRIISGPLKADVVIQVPGHTLTLGAGRDVTIIIFADNRTPEPRKEGEQ